MSYKNTKIQSLTQMLLFCIYLMYSSELLAFIYPESTPVVKYLKNMKSALPPSGVKNVDGIYVINLKKRPEKWRRMKQLLRNKGMYAGRFMAVDGWNISLEAQQELAGNYSTRMLPGEIGCLLSHVSVIKDAIQNDFKIAWILEDDIEFIEDPHQISSFIEALNSADPKWDILYTDIESKNNLGVRVPALDADFRPDRQSDYPLESYLQRVPISDDLMRLGQRYGMYSFLISRKGMKKIYNYFTHVYLWTAIDIDIHYIPNIREYSTTRDIVSIWSQSPYSDTKNGHCFNFVRDYSGCNAPSAASNSSAIAKAMPSSLATTSGALQPE